MMSLHSCQQLQCHTDTCNTIECKQQLLNSSDWCYWCVTGSLPTYLFQSTLAAAMWPWRAGDSKIQNKIIWMKREKVYTQTRVWSPTVWSGVRPLLLVVFQQLASWSKRWPIICVCPSLLTGQEIKIPCEPETLSLPACYVEWCPAIFVFQF